MYDRRAVSLGVLLAVTHCRPDNPVDGSEHQQE
jgi:hypothetical protein